MTKKLRPYILLLALYVTIFGSQQLLGWPLVRIWGASPWGYAISADLRAVLDSAECLATQPLTAFYSAGFEECHYIYGNTLIFIINGLGISPWGTAAISWLFLLIISAIFAHVTLLFFEKVGSMALRIAAIASLCSPPIALLLERANFDILIFAIMYTGVIFASKNRVVAASLAFALGALMKFYAILGFAIYCLQQTRMREKVWISIIFSVTALVIAVEVIARRPTIPEDIGGAFGIHSIGLWFNFATKYLGLEMSLGPIASWALGFLAFLLGTYLTSRYLSRFESSARGLKFDLSGRKFDDLLAGAMCATFVGCYFLGTNFDYRLVFFIPFALMLISNFAEGAIRNRIGALLVLSLWLSYDSGVIGQVIGDALMIIWASISALAIIRTSRAFMEHVLRSRRSKNA